MQDLGAEDLNGGQAESLGLFPFLLPLARPVGSWLGLGHTLLAAACTTLPLYTTKVWDCVPSLTLRSVHRCLARVLTSPRGTSSLRHRGTPHTELSCTTSCSGLAVGPALGERRSCSGAMAALVPQVRSPGREPEAREVHITALGHRRAY